MNEIRLFVEKLWDSGRREYGDLKREELSILTALIMKNSNCPYEFIVETPLSDKLEKDLIAYLLDQNLTTGAEVLATIATGAKIFARNQIEELFQERAELEPNNNSPTETELMLLAYQREVAQEMNVVANKYA